MHKVRIDFDSPHSLTIDLDDEQYEAAMADDWQDFYSLMEDLLMEHLYAETMISDIRDVDY